MTRTSRSMIVRNKSQWHTDVECYTEPWLLDRIAEFLGVGYLDPCPARNGKRLEINGLAIPWRGAVFCNPPYGRAIKPWIAKAVTEPVSDLILLLPAYTETQWFAPLFRYTICFVYQRLRFDRPGQVKGHGQQVPHASVLVYRGKRHKPFADAFCDLGPVMRPYRAYQANTPKLLTEAS